MKDITKTLVFATLGLLLGLGAVKAYDALTHTSMAVAGDFSAHVENAGEAIVLYSTSTCQYCTKARDFLETHDITYAEVLLDGQPSARSQELYQSLETNSVPVLISQDQRLLGFQEDEYRAFVAEVD